MRASKENATKALRALKQWGGCNASYAVVFDFITAALRKLPSERAYERDRKRVRKS